MRIMLELQHSSAGLDEYNATVEGSFSVSLTDRAESVNGRNLAGFTNAATLFVPSASGYGNLYGEMAWGDYDGNGHLDLYITKNGSPNKLFHNHGTGLFSNAAQVGLDHNGSGDCNWMDIDGMGIWTSFRSRVIPFGFSGMIRVPLSK